MSPKRDEGLLADVEDLCRETREYVVGVDLEEFLGSKALQRAVERTLELIGEAATQLGNARPEIGVPWDRIMALRVVLAHAYHKVDSRLLFETATRSVPELLAALEQHRAANKARKSSPRG